MSAHIPASFTKLPLAEAGSNWVSTREALLGELPCPCSDGQAVLREGGPVFATRSLGEICN